MATSASDIVQSLNNTINGIELQVYRPLNGNLLGNVLLVAGNLLDDVVAFAKANGLSGKDVLVSGHSLGGLAVNSMADLSGGKWGGFFADSNYIAYASPTQSSTDKKRKHQACLLRSVESAGEFRSLLSGSCSIL